MSTTRGDDKSTCRPEEHIIQLDPRHQIKVVIDDEGHQRYVPQRWVTMDDPNEDPAYETGFWKSLLPEGMNRLTIVEARNDCAQHAGIPTL